MLFVLGYTFYYLLGYYLHQYPLKGRNERILMFGGALSFLLTGIFRIFWYDRFAWGTNMFQYNSPNIIIMSVALYSLCNRIQRTSVPAIFHKIVNAISKVNFGIYLSHLLVIELLKKSFLYHAGPNEIVMRIIRTILVIVICFGMTKVIRKIPKIGKLIT